MNPGSFEYEARYTPSSSSDVRTRNAQTRRSGNKIESPPVPFSNELLVVKTAPFRQKSRACYHDDGLLAVSSWKTTLDKFTDGEEFLTGSHSNFFREGAKPTKSGEQTVVLDDLSVALTETAAASIHFPEPASEPRCDSLDFIEAPGTSSHTEVPNQIREARGAGLGRLPGGLVGAKKEVPKDRKRGSKKHRRRRRKGSSSRSKDRKKDGIREDRRAAAPPPSSVVVSCTNAPSGREQMKPAGPQTTQRAEGSNRGGRDLPLKVEMNLKKALSDRAPLNRRTCSKETSSESKPQRERYWGPSRHSLTSRTVWSVSDPRTRIPESHDMALQMLEEASQSDSKVEYDVDRRPTSKLERWMDGLIDAQGGTSHITKSSRGRSRNRLRNKAASRQCAPTSNVGSNKVSENDNIESQRTR